MIRIVKPVRAGEREQEQNFAQGSNLMTMCRNDVFQVWAGSYHSLALQALLDLCFGVLRNTLAYLLLKLTLPLLIKSRTSQTA